MWTFFLTTVNLPYWVFLNLLFLFLASAQRIIFLRNCSSLWLRNGDQKPSGLLFPRRRRRVLPATTILRLLVYKFIPIYSVLVFLRTNPNAFGNRPRLIRGSGPLSIRLLFVLAQLTNGLQVCRIS